ncbi:hypothetical protein SARC_16477 [Sphaeroforma arctica JP610]|uniref:Uncharacterized protein n=1 Tax=Sphaeroforma arctica JP610 TaxID=667725 RepID=A0A0L0F2Z2_9EUKA|nr:hypothetical protein SARC_16477 [Sphaeroforma arctica JP610]KNC70989.1 hypothetical protein SARC_16477 [Sphaeroforma arctica JP610]|eukprot:XP_014144891.1 hypothetical protein SARC_16477 [Sphaeroforma arctica JP610]
MVPFYYPVWVSATCEQLGPQTVGNTPYEHNEQLRYLLPNQSLEMVIPMPLAHLEGQTVTVSLKINSTMLYDTQVGSSMTPSTPQLLTNPNH